MNYLNAKEISNKVYELVRKIEEKNLAELTLHDRVKITEKISIFKGSGNFYSVKLNGIDITVTADRLYQIQWDEIDHCFDFNKHFEEMEKEIEKAIQAKFVPKTVEVNGRTYQLVEDEERAF